MDTTIILPICHAFQALDSAYNLQQCYVSITDLQTYEKTSQKAAKWSTAASRELVKTRRTQGVMALTILLTFLSSATLATHRYVSTSHNSTSPLFSSLASSLPPLPAYTEISTAVLNAAVLLAGWVYVGSYWKPKEKVEMPWGVAGKGVSVPGMREYNEAVERTKGMLGNMPFVAASWVVCAGLNWFGF